MTANGWMRASDNDRESTAQVLSEAYAVGRLSREELEQRATAAYSATTWAQLRKLTGDLPQPAISIGLAADTAAARSTPRQARTMPISLMICILGLVLMAGLAYLVTPLALWVAAVLLPLVLMLPPAIGISRQCGACGRTQTGHRDGKGAGQ